MISAEHVRTLNPSVHGMGFGTVRMVALLAIIAIVFAGSPVGAQLPETLQMAESIVTTTKMTMSESAWRDGVNQWLETNLFKTGAAPFSFVYDGKNSGEFLKNWDFSATKKQLPDTGTQLVLTYLDKETGLVALLVLPDHAQVFHLEHELNVQHFP